MDSRTRELVFRIRDYSCELTETELLALLLEDKLIKEHLPAYNVRQKEYEQYRYLKITDDAYPTCVMLSHPEMDESLQVFGPFRDEYFVEDVLKVLHQCFYLRACTEAVPTNVCLSYDIGQCIGPCRGDVSHDEYASIVNHVLDFLDGNESEAVSRLTQRMEDHARKLGFEKAAEIKQQLDFCKRFCARQRFIREFRERSLVFLHRADDLFFAYTFAKGRFCGHKKVSSNTDLSQLSVGSGNSGSEEDNRFVFDRANIVFNWLSNERNQCEWQFR
jgi:excinuclease ABC subunit C